MMDKVRGLTTFVRKSNCKRLDFRLGEGRLTSQTATRCLAFKVQVLSVVEKAGVLTVGSGDSVR